MLSFQRLKFKWNSYETHQIAHIVCTQSQKVLPFEILYPRLRVINIWPLFPQPIYWIASSKLQMSSKGYCAGGNHYVRHVSVSVNGICDSNIHTSNRLSNDTPFDGSKCKRLMCWKQRVGRHWKGDLMKET